MRPSSTLLRCLWRTWPHPSPRASPAELIPAAAKRLYHTPRTSIPLRPSLVLSRLRTTSPTARCESTSANHTPQAGASTKAPESRLDRDQVPAYELTFTCKKCSTRSSHRVSKQGYHHGTVLITCPGCKNRHLMSDHMKIFSDKPVTIEDLMREKGQFVKRGSLSADGDVEFWDDGSTTARSSNFIPSSAPESEPDAAKGALTAPATPQESAQSGANATPEKP